MKKKKRKGKEFRKDSTSPGNSRAALIGGTGHVLKKPSSILLWIPVCSMETQIMEVCFAEDPSVPGLWNESTLKVQAPTSPNKIKTHLLVTDGNPHRTSSPVFILYVRIEVDGKCIIDSLGSLCRKVIFRRLGKDRRALGFGGGGGWDSVSFEEHSSRADAARAKTPATPLSPVPQITALGCKNTCCFMIM